uniref:Amino_oxidase domain-containing protein n=1 Tax=Heterorhabditis bacteriophora TaxID=37862 RepID=A0A1I7WYX0_HETBA
MVRYSGHNSLATSYLKKSSFVENHADNTSGVARLKQRKVEGYHRKPEPQQPQRNEASTVNRRYRLWNIRSKIIGYLDSNSITLNLLQKESKKSKPSIAIIGAGIGGLSAARRLIEYGMTDIDIYEGMTRIGGRIHPIPYQECLTRRVPIKYYTRYEKYRYYCIKNSDGGYLQMGAQFINGAKNPIYKIAKELGVITEIVSDTAHLEHAEFLTGNQSINRKDIDLFMEFIEPLDLKYRELAKNHDLLSKVYTIKTIFMEDYARFIKVSDENNATGARRQLFDALTRPYRSYWEFEWAADWEDLSPRVLKEFNDLGHGRESYLTNKFGYTAILYHIESKIPRNTFHMNVTITNIRHSAHCIVLTSKNGEIMKNYDYVIVTSSLGHLKKYHHKLFTPPLPRQKKDAIEKIGMLFLI